MKARLLASFALSAALLAGTVAALPAKTPPAKAHPAAAKDWTLVTGTAPGGGFVMGNPAAKVRLVEYSSFTCPHCAHFSNEAMGALRDSFIRPGKVLFESRNAVRDPLDLAATLLARCDGPARYFATSDLLFARQDDILAAATAYEQAQGDKPRSAAPAVALGALADGAGITAILHARGMSPARVKACLADKVGQQRVAAMVDEAANRRHIPGTPAFLINDALVEPMAWPGLDQRLRDALN